MTSAVPRLLSILPAALLLGAFDAGEARALSFVAELTPCQVVPVGSGLDPCGSATSSGTATFELNEAETELAYSITLDGIDILSGIQGMHFHIGVPGENGPHVLNLLGLPSQDDSDISLDPGTNTISGIYDDSDENLDAAGMPGVRDPGDSVALTGVLDELKAGNFYVAVHTTAYSLPNTSELRGQIVPEPSTGALIAAGLLLGTVRRRR